jgi:hypothetical protein
MDSKSLEAAFRKGFGAWGGGGTAADLAAFLHPRALVVADGHTAVLTAAQFQDSVAFELGNSEAITLRTYDERFEVAGDTGIVSSVYTLRSKPRGSGFRLRHGTLTVVCQHAGSDGWRAVAVTIDPLHGHIERASPG